MLALRKILLKGIVYYLILFMAIIMYIIAINNPVKTIYNNFNNKEFTIINIEKKDYGIKYTLKAKEKVIGYQYLEKNIEKEYKKYSLGDKVKVNGIKNKIKNNTIENTFNYKKYLYSQKIYNEIEIKQIEIIDKNKNIFNSIKSLIIKRTEKLSKSSPYINGLILGNNKYIDEEVIKSYRDNGISHLFAISGTHISIFIGIIYLILKKIKIKENKRYLIVILFLIFYMFITNFSMSIIRASIFTILLIINKIFYFHIKSIYLLILTLAIIMFINPLYINNIGLQFSVIISAFLIIFNGIINKCKTKIEKLFMTSYISFLASLPITINNFYQINILLILYNIFFVPYMSIILLPFTLVSYIFPFLDDILYLLIRINELISLLVARFTIGIYSICKLSLSIIVIYFAIIIINFYQMQRGKSKYNYLVIIMIIFLIIRPLVKTERMTFLDIGQGDSAILNLKNKTIMIDTGGIVMYNDNKYTYKLSKNKILPYVKSKGIKKIDYLILTHGDADHMLEASYIINNFPVKKIYINCNELNYLEENLKYQAINKRIKIEKLCQNDRIQINNHTIYSLNKKRDNENDSSIVLYTKINDYKILLTGDISQNIEKEIINEYSLDNLYILKLAHHGSKTSSNISFLEKTKPKYSIISVGENNRFNHPSQETITNLKKLKLKYIQTKEKGSITFNLKDGTYITTPP